MNEAIPGANIPTVKATSGKAIRHRVKLQFHSQVPVLSSSRRSSPQFKLFRLQPAITTCLECAEFNNSAAIYHQQFVFLLMTANLRQRISIIYVGCINNPKKSKMMCMLPTHCQAQIPQLFVNAGLILSASPTTSYTVEPTLRRAKTWRRQTMAQEILSVLYLLTDFANV